MAVAYGNLSIITNATLGSGPVEAVSGAYDIGMTRTADVGLGRGSQQLSMVGDQQISLGDIMNAPSMSFDAIMSNARQNAVPAAIAAISFNIGASVFKKIMRKPFNQANKLVKPLGLNVRLG
jgi:GH24 family phage-related lysozyme (muramidase)